MQFWHFSSIDEQISAYKNFKKNNRILKKSRKINKLIFILLEFVGPDMNTRTRTHFDVFVTKIYLGIVKMV